jgi:TolB-like protein/DNA-binding winged helix-turn-helix (wHTH) protein/Tfp pilus assembly protein PilF
MLSTDEIIYYDFGDFRVDVGNHQLLKDGKPLPLTHKAFSTLLILVRNAGQIVEKEDIISELWTDSFVEESNLSQYVYILRKLLGHDANGNPYIETITKRGFRFTAQVEEIPAAFHISNDVLSSEIINDDTFEAQHELNGNNFHHTSIPPDVVVNHDENLSNEAVEESTDRRFLKTRLPLKINRLWLQFVVLAVLILGLISIALYVYKNPQTTAQNGSSNIKSIAVLPFRQIGAENPNDKLGLGMADSIITHLSRSKLIPVRPTSAIFQFADKPNVDSIEVGQKLNVDAVLEGTILRDNERVRVSVKFINVKNGESVWAETYDENFTNIIALQDAISNTVARSISQNLNIPKQEIVHSTSNTEAYQAYLVGVYFWNIRTKEGLEKAAENFQKAVEIDPNYAQAYAMLADSYNMLGYYGYADMDEMMKKARPAVEKALALDNSIPEAHLVMSYIERKENKNPERANQELEKAIALNPYNSTARVRYGWAALGSGNVDESIKQMRLAQEYNPLSTTSNNALCDVLMIRHEFDDAIRFCQKAVEVSPNQILNHIRLAEAYFFSGKQQEAIDHLQKRINSLEGEGKDQALGLLSYFYAKAHQRPEAEKIVAILKSKIAADPNLYEYLIPATYALGNDEESLTYLKQARQKRFSDNLFRARYALMWEDIRADKRFAL